MSWIRKRDLHIMTIGILTYTNDQRYQALHTEGSDEWSLRVMSAQPRDSGVYECQVSTEPKISQAYRLNVVGELSQILFVLECFWALTTVRLKKLHPLHIVCSLERTFIYFLFLAACQTKYSHT